MSRAKIEKLLALAYGTTNKEEAATAFGRAVAYANQAGIDLRTINVPGAKTEPERREYRARSAPIRIRLVSAVMTRWD